MRPGGTSMLFDRCYQIRGRAKSTWEKNCRAHWEEVSSPGSLRGWTAPEKGLSILQPLLQLGLWDLRH